VDNVEIAKLLRSVAASYSIKDEKKYRFQIIAYTKAADSIEQFPKEIRDLVKYGKAVKLPGVGQSISTHLVELITTGKVKRFEEIMRGIPKSVFPLLDIPSFGPKKAFKLVTIFDLKDPKTVLSELKKLAVLGKISTLEGFGEKSQADIFRALSEYDKGVDKTSRMLLSLATSLSDQMIEYMKKCPDVTEVYPLGSLRRSVSTIGDIDLAVATNNPEAVLDHFIKSPFKDRVLERGPATSSILIGGGKHIDLMVQPPERFGSLLQHFTGSKNHNVQLREYALKKGLSLSEYGIKKITKENASKKVRESENTKTYSSEKEFYHSLGLEWIPPEIREGTGEIELARQKKLPELVETKDIKGDLHLHSNFPIEPSHDLGASSFTEMIETAEKLNYHYIGFSEHNPGVSKHSNDQIFELILNRNESIDNAQKKNKSVRVFKLLEIDILASGDLAIDDKSMKILDAGLVSIHSSFSMTKQDMTKRVLSGLSHPKAKILCHPTGRLLNKRPGIDLDWEKVFSFCLKHKKALEINASPQRLDLPDTLVKEARTAGVKFVISTDSHNAEHMKVMRHGVSVARRGWSTKDDILNTLEYNKFVKWLIS